MNRWAFAGVVIGVTVAVVLVIALMTTVLVGLLGDLGGVISIGIILVGLFLVIALTGGRS